MSALKKATEEYQALERVRIRLEQIIRKIRLEEAGLRDLEKELKKEHQDVIRLEKLSVKGMFHDFLGDKKKQLEIERQEYLDAVLRFNECIKFIELLEFEKGVLEEKLKKEPALKNRLKELRKKREAEIMRSGSDLGRQILGIEKEIDQYLAVIREIREALIIGEKIMELLTNIVKQLGVTNQWGYHDNMYVSYNPHADQNNVDAALRIAYKVKQLLLQYEDELNDIYGKRRFKLAATMNTIIHFTDNIRVNLISDWVIQEKIQNTFHSVMGFRDQIQRVNDALKVELNNTEKGIKYLEEKKQKLLEDI